MRPALLALLVVSSPAVADRLFAKGAIAAAHPLASAAGEQMLRQGGNAADAAVAAAFVMAVVGPYHSGLGGGGFAVGHDAKAKATWVLDFREVAPAAATRDMFVRDSRAVSELSTDGALSVAVPGAPKGYLELLAEHGRLGPARVLAPAIQVAERGFPVTPKYRDLARRRLDCLRKDTEAARLFLRPNARGEPDLPELSTVLAQPELARTLRALARQGPKAFYEGRTAQAIADTVQAAGGILSRDDLSRFATRRREPLWGTYRGHRLATMPPPSAGGLAVLQTLQVLELSSSRGLPSREVDVLHRFVETLRRSYLDRARYLGDPAFVEIPLERLLSREHAQATLAGIDPARATPSRTLSAAPVEPRPRPDGGALPDKSTTHVSVIDGEGNAVALTTTVNYYFGSCLVAKGTGVLLNDEMDDFAALPLVPNAYGLVTGEANAVAPGKIPLSSMSPTLVFAPADPGRVMLAVGSPGGSTIPSTVIQVISNVIDGPMDVERAVGFGRLHHQYLPDEVLLDAWALEPATQKALAALGHKLRVVDGWGDAEAVLRDPQTGLFTAGSDPRNEGHPAGADSSAMTPSQTRFPR